MRMLLVVALLVFAFAGSTSAEGEWVLWVKPTTLWVGFEKESGGPLRTFPAKSECLQHMEDVINQIAAWNNGNGVRASRDGNRLTLQVPSDPPRVATVEYSCVPGTI